MQAQLNAEKSLAQNYKFFRTISSGSFGTVYEVKNTKTKQISALKIQYRNQPSSGYKVMMNQIMILQKLQGVTGIPELKSFGKFLGGTFFEMELLQQPINGKIKKTFSLNELKIIAKELILILKRIHQKKIIHQDVKPQNIMKDSQGNYYFIDFGLSKYKGIKQSQRAYGFIGTPRFASIAAHRGQIQTQKDDLESLFYVLAFLHFGNLPWFRVKAKKEKKQKAIQKIKEIHAFEVFQAMSKGFFTAFQYIKQLKPREQLNYQYIITLLGKQRNTTLSHFTLSTMHSRNSVTLKNIPLANLQQSQLENEHSANTFSKNAHCQFASLIQITVQKILFDHQFLEVNEENVKNSDEPEINDLTKQSRVIVFKNPFLLS